MRPQQMQGHVGLQSKFQANRGCRTRLPSPGIKRKRKIEYVSNRKIQTLVVCKTKELSVLYHDAYVEILTYIKKC